MESWTGWAVGEGLTKTFSRLLQKLAGATSGSLAGTLLITLVIGGVQFFGGFGMAMISRARFTPSLWQVFGGLVFGVFATASTIFGIWAFTYPGADIGVTTFLVLTAIVPGAILDWLFFGNRLIARQMLGIAMFLFSGWAMFNFPDVGTLAHFPIWGVLSLGAAATNAINEAITRKIALQKKPNVFVNNGWIGLSTIVCTALIISVVGFHPVMQEFSRPLLFEAVGIGLAVLAMISFKLKAFVSGEATIALKNLMMMGVYLITVVIAGHFLFGEAVTWGKGVGVAGFFIAFLLMDKQVWRVIANAAAYANSKQT